MLRISSIFNFKKWPWALVGCLFLLLAAECVVRWNLPSLQTFSQASIAYKKKLLETSWAGKEAVNGIVMGDSRILGLHAKEISTAVSAVLAQQGRPPLELYNYGFPNHGPRGYYLLFKKYLRYNPCPKVIVFSSSPYSLTRHWNLMTKDEPIPMDIHRFASLFSIRECLEVLPRRVMAQVLLAKLERLSALIMYRGRIQMVLDDPSLFNDKSDWLKRSMSVSNGGTIVGPNVPATLQEIQESEYYVNEFLPDQNSVYWHEKFFSLAQEKGVTVIILNAPLVQPLYDKREATGENLRYAQLMQSFKDKFDNIILLEPLIEGYAMEYFFDTHHLNKKGLKRFSRETSSKLAELFGNQGVMPLQKSGKAL